MMGKPGPRFMMPVLADAKRRDPIEKTPVLHMLLNILYV